MRKMRGPSLAFDAGTEDGADAMVASSGAAVEDFFLGGNE